MNQAAQEENRSSPYQAAAEIALIFTLFFVLAGTPPPDVNEAHYLTKAKHYWDPSWCSRDHFLNSADAHLVFYWTFGWLTRFFTLPAVAWIGRFATWLLLAWSWRRMSFAIIPHRMYSVLTAAMFVSILRWGHMSGEWIIGGVEAKGFAYVFVLLAIESIVRLRWRSATIFLGLASAMHAVIGGWSFIASAVAWMLTRREARTRLSSLMPSLLLGGSFALFGVIPGLSLSWSADDATVIEANRIYVFERLPHHLVFHALPHAHIARHVAIALAWGFFAWRLFKSQADRMSMTTLNKFVIGAVGIAVAGALVDQSLLFVRPVAASLLRYYWFRLSDFAVPVGMTFVLSTWLYHLGQARSPQFAIVLFATLAGITTNVIHVVIGHRNDPLPGAISQASLLDSSSAEEKLNKFRDWQQVCEWIQESTPEDALFMTPRHQQTFHWYAGRSEVVSVKNVPQDAKGIVEWRERLVDVFPWTGRHANLTTRGERGIRELAKKYGFRYIVVDRTMSSPRWRFPLLYPESRRGSHHYEVYLIPDEPL